MHAGDTANLLTLPCRAEVLAVQGQGQGHGLWARPLRTFYGVSMWLPDNATGFYSPEGGTPWNASPASMLARNSSTACGQPPVSVRLPLTVRRSPLTDPGIVLSCLVSFGSNSPL